jgi:hypothetical protein
MAVIANIEYLVSIPLRGIGHENGYIQLGAYVLSVSIPLRGIGHENPSYIQANQKQKLAFPSPCGE